MDLEDTRVDQKKTQSGDFSFRRFFLRQAKQSDYSEVEKISTKFMRTSSDISSVREEMVSTSEIYSAVLGDEFVGDNGSLLSLQPWIFKRDKSLKRVEECSDSSSRWSFDWGDFSWSPRGSPRRINPNSHSIGLKKRRQGGCNLRHVTFTDNFFTPHLRSENVGIEEHTFKFHPSSSVKDERLSCLIPGSRDNRLKVEQPENRCDGEFGSLVSSEKVSVDQLGGSVTEKLRTVMGVPHLPLRRLRKAEGNSGESILGSLDASFSQKLGKISDPKDSRDGMFLFLLGVAIGVTSNVTSHRIEVEKLNKLLKENKNLVQDLHEELEMKDLLTVKELGNGADGNEELERNYLHESIDGLQNQNSNWHDTAQKMDDCDNVFSSKVGKNLSEIEAELEAELERLELNINASSREQMTSHLLEVDSELTVDVVSGGFREDLLVKCIADDGKEATTSTTEAYDANYSVSPKELSLRLHKVIESRLEERIKELETELEQSQLKLKLVEAERATSTKPPFSSSDAGSSNHDTPNSGLRSDMSGDALIAYDEAYEEFMRLADTEDDKLSYSICSEDKNISKDCEKDEACEQILWRSGSYDISATDDEDDGGGDNDGEFFFEGKDLIQKILEKTKKGSPALLKAQKMFLMLDL